MTSQGKKQNPPLLTRQPSTQGGRVWVCGFGWVAGSLMVRLAGWLADGHAQSCFAGIGACRFRHAITLAHTAMPRHRCWRELGATRCSTTTTSRLLRATMGILSRMRTTMLTLSQPSLQGMPMPQTATGRSLGEYDSFDHCFRLYEYEKVHVHVVVVQSYHDHVRRLHACCRVSVKILACKS